LCTGATDILLPIKTGRLCGGRGGGHPEFWGQTPGPRVQAARRREYFNHRRQ